MLLRFSTPFGVVPRHFCLRSRASTVAYIPHVDHTNRLHCSTLVIEWHGWAAMGVPEADPNERVPWALAPGGPEHEEPEKRINLELGTIAPQVLQLHLLPSLKSWCADPLTALAFIFVGARLPRGSLSPLGRFSALAESTRARLARRRTRLAVTSMRSVGGGSPTSPHSQAKSAPSRAHISAAAFPAANSNCWSV